MSLSEFADQVNQKPLKRHKKDEFLKQKVQRKKFKAERKLKKLEKQIVKKKSQTQDMIVISEEDDEAETNGRDYTISIALPGSILDNAQSPELRSYLAGQIARACAIYQVDEVVVFNEADSDKKESVEGEFKGVGKKGDGCVQLARILQYLECPQYLRKFFFPKHPDLQYAGLLNPLDSPHHMRIDEDVPFREGVVLDRPTKEGKGSFVNCGAVKNVQIDKKLQSNVRVTVQMLENKEESPKYFRGKAVSPTTPRLKHGLYWGYSVRLAPNLSSVFTQCSIADKYDIMIGTSERGESIDDFILPSFKHLLIVFGGVKGLEESLSADEDLDEVDDPSCLFHHYLNTCPNQGSRTIRTEEAILITLSALRPKVMQSIAIK
uniref:putative methyltransferase C9orf114 n=1 Tax=Styela clava TaxID=7725 RepID=UPI001939391F|nr:putative methyltransferase C9orf114 [Styela clava]